MTQFSFRIADDAELADWNAAVDAAPTGTPFHRLEWLRAAAAESRSQLHLLVCEKQGEGIVCRLPLFAMRKGPFRLLLSPPPGCAIPYLGPVYSLSSPKQYRIEADLEGVAQALDGYLKAAFPHHYIRVITSPELTDVRSFLWSGFAVRPEYTYRMPLREGKDAVLKDFDQRVRYRTKQAQARDDWAVRCDAEEDYPNVLRHVRQRYAEQQRRFSPSDGYFSSLREELGGTVLRTRAIVAGEQWVSGMIFLRHNGNLKLWIGGAKPNGSFIGANERLHWDAIQHGINDGVAYYERIGANTPRLCKNKSKYNLRPVPYYVLERGSLLARLAAEAYARLRGGSDGDVDE
jgi:CelD/BcsL family acetyltransferase involved in cellulose biosynthesis